MFGAQASSSSFGATPFQSTPGLFGASSAGLFNTPSPSPGTLFGASSSVIGSQPATGLFGASQPAPQFGASSASLFGANANTGSSLFGAASSSSLFGAASSGSLFGGATSGGLGGASSSSLFGAASSSGLFGQVSSGGLFGAASSASLFGAVSSGGLFGGASSTSLFGAASSGGLFGSTGGGLFGGAATLQPAPQPQQQYELGKDGRPITHETSFSDLPEHWQSAFKNVHQKVSEIRRDWQALKTTLQAQQAGLSNQEFADLSVTARQLHVDLEGAGQRLEQHTQSTESFHADVLELAEATSLMHSHLKANVIRREIETCRDEAQKQAKIMQNAALFKSVKPLPAPYLSSAVAGFKKELQRLYDLHRELAAICEAEGASAHGGSLAALPDVMRNLHELFLHAASRTSALQTAANELRASRLRVMAANGVHLDPFAESDAQAALQDSERNQLPAARPLKPSAVAQSTATVAPSAPFGQLPASTPQLALPAPASSSSLFGSSLTGGQAFGSSNRSNVKAKRR